MEAFACPKCGGRALRTAHGLAVCLCGWNEVPATKAARPLTADTTWLRVRPAVNELMPRELAQLTPYEREQLLPPRHPPRASEAPDRDDEGPPHLDDDE